MRVKVCDPDVRDRGFTLVEASVAVALLALCCVAVAGAVHVSMKAEAAERGRRAERVVLAEEAARLRALPFFTRQDALHEGPPSLLAEVFPHARVALNTGAEWFAGDGGEAAFVSEVTVGGRVVRRTARLSWDTAGVLEPLSASDVRDWAVWEAGRPPALVVDVTLELPGETGTDAARHLVFRALPAGTAS
jgi:prepilin-type N-terminal cleavage/methylation domain-containing protein